MIDTTYLDFDFRIKYVENRYQVDVFNSPVGEAHSQFIMPFTPQELENFQEKIHLATTGEITEAVQMGDAQEIGERLFRATFSGDVQLCLESSWNAAYHQRTHLRIRFHVDSGQEFAHLPWEYLYDPGRDEFIALSIHSPFMRYVEMMHHIRPYPIRPPLRVLVVVANPDNYSTLDIEQEWLGLVDTIDYLSTERLMVFERLYEPTLFNLKRQLQRNEYHIIHFVGHCVYDPSSQNSRLIFEDDMGRGRLVSGEHLGSLLRDHYSLRLAVLNIRGDVAEISQNLLPQIGQMLVKRGVPAVVAICSTHTNKAAVAFCHEFYAAVAELYPLDVAVASARQSMSRQPLGMTWGAPIFFTRMPDARIFDDGKAPRSAVPMDNLRLRISQMNSEK